MDGEDKSTIFVNNVLFYNVILLTALGFEKYSQTTSTANDIDNSLSLFAQPHDGTFGIEYKRNFC